MTTPIDPAEPLEKNELAFAIELARGSSVAQAAAATGISEPTGYRWAKKEPIRSYVEDVRAEVLQCASSRIFGIATQAVETLHSLLGSDSEQIRLSTARVIIDASCKLRQLADLETEIAQIRSLVVELQQQHQMRKIPTCEANYSNSKN